MSTIRKLRAGVCLLAATLMALPTPVLAQQAGTYWFRWKTVTAQTIGNESPEIPTGEEVTPGVPPMLSLNEPLLATVGETFAVGYRESNINAISSVGSFPPGLVIDVKSRSVRGVPSRQGQFTFSLKGYAKSPDATLTVVADPITVDVAPKLEISVDAIPVYMVGDTVEPIQVATTNPGKTTFGGYNFPIGVGISTSGVISGTANELGSREITIQAVNDRNRYASYKTGMTVVDVPLVNYDALSFDVMRPGYGRPKAVTVGTTVALTEGALPPGMTLAENGAISGTPTEMGTYTFSASASRSGRTNSYGPFTINVVIGSIAVVPGAAQKAYVGNPIVMAAQPSSDGRGPVTWSATGLPPGVSINSATGIISGTVGGTVAPGAFPVTLSAIDSLGRRGTGKFSINVMNPSVVVSAPTDVIAGVSAFTRTEVSSSNSNETQVTFTDAYALNAAAPVTWSLRNAPPWVSISSVTDTKGRLAGVPPEGGTVSFDVVAMDFNKVVAAAPLSFSVLPGLKMDVPKFGISVIGGMLAVTRQPSATGGDGTYSWSISHAPAWLSINSATGALSGIVAGDGTISFDLTVRDGHSHTSTRNVSANIIDSRSLGMTLTAPVVGPAYVGDPIAIAAQSNLEGGVAPFVWEMSGTGDGLSIDAATGSLAAAPTTTEGDTSHTITVTDASGVSVSAVLRTSVFRRPIITGPVIADGYVGKPISVSRQAYVVGGAPTISWSIADAPPGINVDPATGAVSGTPTQKGTFSFKLSAVDRLATAVNVDGSLKVGLTPVDVTPPAVSTSVINGYLNVTSQASASGGLPPYAWSLVDAPSWISIDPDSGALSGLPTAPGSWTFGVVATDSAGQVGNAAANVSVNGPLAMDVAPVVTAAGVVAEAVEVTTQAHAIGGVPPYRWTLSAAPTGITADVSSGFIAGAFQAAGVWSPTLLLTDARGTTVSSALPTMIVSPTKGSDPDAPDAFKVALSISDDIVVGHVITGVGGVATNAKGSVTWSLFGGPAWLSIDADGSFRGTPPQVGTVKLTLVGNDGSTIATAPVTLVVGDFGVNLPRFAAVQTIGEPIDIVTQPAAVGGKAPFSWSLVNAPASIQIAAASGTISGTVPSASATFTVKVTDADGVSRSGNVTLTALPRVSVTAPVIADGEVSLALKATQQASATGGKPPYKWTAATAPNWVTVNADTGAIGGVPAVGDDGQRSVSLRVIDADGRVGVSTAASFRVYDLLALTPPDIIASVDFPMELETTQQAVARGGYAPYTFSVTGAPSWMSLDPATGRLTGTPTAEGTHGITISVVDSIGKTISTDVTFTVEANHIPPIVITAPSAGSVQTVGTPLAVTGQPTVTGGYGSKTWALSSAPSWMSINPATGVIAGTPTDAGSFTATVTATDTRGKMSSASFSFAVDTPLSMATAVSNQVLYYGDSLNVQPNAVGGSQPYTWTISTSAPWITADNTTGNIVGQVPQTPSSQQVTYGARDAKGRTVSSTFTVTTYNPVLTPPAGYENQNVNEAMKITSQGSITGGVSPYKWSVTGLPTGLSINATTGALGGIPTQVGTFNPVITVTDANNVSRQATLNALKVSAGTYQIVVTGSVGNASSYLMDGTFLGTGVGAVAKSEFTHYVNQRTDKSSTTSSSFVVQNGTPPYKATAVSGSTAFITAVINNATTGAFTGYCSGPSARGVIYNFKDTTYTAKWAISDSAGNTININIACVFFVQ